MDQELLKSTARQLMAGDKGLIAMDESTATCNKRFEENGIPQTEEYRRKYRQLIVTTPGLAESISGAILFDETTKQLADDGTPLIDVLVHAGVIPGIKLDGGAKDMPAFPGEKITEGLDGLFEKLQGYAAAGLKFAKWRAVFVIGAENRSANGLEVTPTMGSIYANAYVLARYAALCQEAGLVPIVEPEVLMDGNHSIEQCFEATQKVLHLVFEVLVSQRVYLEGIILKPNMVISGLDFADQASVEEVAEETITCLLRCVPPAVPGIAFLSGGQEAHVATAHLNAMHVKYKNLPWAVTFSYSRAVQSPALKYWAGKDENVAVAQELLKKRLQLNNVARRGAYTVELEQS